MSLSVSIVAYSFLFATVGFGFVLVALLVGRFLRPSNPHPEKQEIYECGEPTIGSSFIQFDLRFYVVALVFIVFDVEVAFMFPWATVYGKATHLMDSRLELVSGSDEEPRLSRHAKALFQELGVSNPTLPAVRAGDTNEAEAAVRTGARNLAWYSVFAVGVFFFVLLLGLAYEWKTGALDWVRAVRGGRGVPVGAPPDEVAEKGAVLTA